MSTESLVKYLDKKMQSFYRMVRSCHETAKQSILQHSIGRDPSELKKIFARLQCVISHPSPANHKGLENTTVAEVLMTKEGERVGPWLWCHSNVTAQDAVTQMAKNDIGSLVVLNPGDNQLIAGILTERDYLKKIAAEGRLAKYTRVGEIMTGKEKLVTITSDTNILHAMKLMTENHIRHVPVIDGKIVGMISMVDLVRTVVEQQGGDVKRLNDFIKGEYF